MIRLDSMTLLNALRHGVDNFPGRTSLSMVDGEGLTFAALDEQVRSVSNALRGRGIIAGDRVAILSENRPNWGIAFFAVTTIGAIAVPILPDFHTNEIHHILRHSESKGLFISKKMYGQLEDGDFPQLGTIFLLDDFSIIPPRVKKNRLEEFFDEGLREFSKLKSAALRLTGKTGETVAEDDVACIIYTSGTTGHSKGVMLTHKNIVSDVISTTQIVDINYTDRFLSILPLSHTYECTLGLVAPVLLGACVYYLDNVPTAAVLLPAMAKIKPTVILSVPLVIEKIYKLRIQPKLNERFVTRNLQKIPFLRRAIHKAAGRKLMQTFGGELRVFTIGGASLAPEVELFLREAKFPYAIGYGLTETSPLVAGTGPHRTRFRSTGPALPGSKIKIDNPNPDTGEGEILVKGPTVMKGYYKDPARTKEVLSADGWFRTGDLGVFDKSGYLYIKGRSKNLILGPSGKNIYPEEIEAAINESDLVLESIAFQEGTKIAARIFLNYEMLEKELSSRDLPESDIRTAIGVVLERIRSQVNERLASFSRVHRFIEQREPFEKTPTQKIKRHLYV